jgi:hypothetical protein
LEKIVIFSEEFHLSIEELTEILFEKEYFGFRIDCLNYTSEIYDFVETYIEFPISQKSPSKYENFGQKYLKYKANQRTM